MPWPQPARRPPRRQRITHPATATLQRAAPQLAACPISNGGTIVRCTKLNRWAQPLLDLP